MSDSRFDLSIIIVSYEVREEIGRCLDALRSVSSQISKEVLVVDNASSDNSAAFIRQQYPQVLLKENSENIGFAAAVNQGLARRRGEFILLLNPDTVVTFGAIAHMINFMDENPRCGIAGARLLNEDGSPQDSITPFPTPWGILQESLFIKKLTEPQPEPVDPEPVDAVVGACLLARREMVYDIGGLDEGFFLYSEEVDWCQRAWLKGWEVYHLPEAVVTHGLSRSSSDRPEDAFVALYRSRTYYMRKHFSWIERWVSQVGMVVGVGLRVILLGITSPKGKKFKQNFAVLLWYLRGAPRHRSGRPTE
ncbi:MAG: glycosyltransferase family 2 protein [Gemmatimonadota bacterium]|nr:glycosyltransferase family 2 protein [Gemmatimonadota bacterium]